MRFFVLAAVSSLALLCGLSSAAKADYFVWQDPASGMSLTYPDTWRLTSNQGPHDVVTLMAPSGRGHASCKVRVEDDKRWAIFPPAYNEDIQQIDYSRKFFDQYLNQYTNPEVYHFADKAGLGLGWVGMAEAGYWSSVPGPTMQRESMMFAALYNNHLYVLDCSAQAQAYPQWKQAFLGVAASVDFVKINHELLTGYYRNFMEDERQRFQNPDDKTLSFY